MYLAGSEFITHYHLVIANDDPDCGLGYRGTYTFNVSHQHADMFVLRASMSSSFPMIGCTYQYTVSPPTMLSLIHI